MSVKLTRLGAARITNTVSVCECLMAFRVNGDSRACGEKSKDEKRRAEMIEMIHRDPVGMKKVEPLSLVRFLWRIRFL